MMEIGERNTPIHVSSRAHAVFFVAMMSATIYDLRIVSALSEGSMLEKLSHDEGHDSWAKRRSMWSSFLVMSMSSADLRHEEGLHAAQRGLSMLLASSPSVA
jgi:hypothetical protein